MNKIHEILSPWMASHPVITLLSALALGIVIGFAIKAKLSGKSK
jgi:hypothetical protein